MIELSRVDALEADIEALIDSHPEWTDGHDLPVEIAYEMKAGDLRWVKRTILEQCEGSTIEPKRLMRLGLRQLLAMMRRVHEEITADSGAILLRIDTFSLRIREALPEDCT